MTAHAAATPPKPRADLAAAAALIGGLAALYLPLYLKLAGGIWQTPDGAHVPLVLAVSGWLFWRERDALAALPDRPAPVAGILTLTAGMVLAVVGRSQDVPMLAMVSQIPVFAGILLLMRGTSALRRVAFPLLYLAFSVPLPGIVIEALTSELKIWISMAAEEILYHLGYPVARSGVALLIGQYRLLVADACSGLHSLLSLAALGLLFVYLRARPSRLHTALMAASILPVALAANLLRVLALMLLTYHQGDATAHWLHEATGVSLFLCALLMFIALDAALGKVLPRAGGDALR